MLSVQSPTTSLCVSSPALTEGEKERKGIQGQSQGGIIIQL